LNQNQELLVTSFIEQPNTVPNAVTQEILEQNNIAARESYANYSFMMGRLMII
jgi:dihydroorotase